MSIITLYINCAKHFIIAIAFIFQLIAVGSKYFRPPNYTNFNSPNSFRYRNMLVFKSEFYLIALAGLKA